MRESRRPEDSLADDPIRCEPLSQVVNRLTLERRLTKGLFFPVVDGDGLNQTAFLFSGC